MFGTFLSSFDVNEIFLGLFFPFQCLVWIRSFLSFSVFNVNKIFLWLFCPFQSLMWKRSFPYFSVLFSVNKVYLELFCPFQSLMWIRSILGFSVLFSVWCASDGGWTSRDRPWQTCVRIYHDLDLHTMFMQQINLYCQYIHHWIVHSIKANWCILSRKIFLNLKSYTFKFKGMWREIAVLRREICYNYC